MTATYINLANASSVDLTGKEGCFVIWDSGLKLASSASDKVIGVITRGGSTRSDVCLFGRCFALVGGEVAPGTALTGGTGGVAAPAGAGARREVAIALESGISGDSVEIMFYGNLDLVVS